MFSVMKRQQENKQDDQHHKGTQQHVTSIRNTMGKPFLVLKHRTMLLTYKFLAYLYSADPEVLERELIPTGRKKEKDII